MERGNLSGKEFRIMIVRMIQDLRTEWRRCNKGLPKPRRTKEQTEMNNTLEVINSRITEAEG